MSQQFEDDIIVSAFTLEQPDGKLMPENELMTYFTTFRTEDVQNAFESNEFYIDMEEHEILNNVMMDNKDRFRKIIRYSVIKSIIALCVDSNMAVISQYIKLMDNKLDLTIHFPVNVQMNNVNAQEYEGEIVTFESKVANWAKIRTVTIKGEYVCNTCEERTQHDYSSVIKKCVNCNSKLEFEKPTQSEDTRRIVLREIIDDFSSGEMPFTINADIYGHTVKKVSLSDKLVVTGVFRSIPLMKESGKITREFIPTIQVICVRKIEDTRSTTMPDENLLSKFRQLEEDGLLVKSVIDGFAYNIYKKENEKKAIICSLIGSKWIGQHGKGNPPMIHILFVGDPDTYKSTIMKYISNVYDNCVLADSTTVSNAGIKASAVKMEDGRMAIRAGLMPEYNKGVVFLDEFGDLKEDIYADLKAPMIDGRVTKHVAGEDFNAQAETGILASMNPVEGVYDNSKTIYENLAKLGKPLITRFDIIFKFSKKSTDYDANAIREHFKKSDIEGKPKEYLTDNEIRLFINYIKNIDPEITIEAVETSNRFFQEIEKKSEDETGSETRTENAIMKFAVALARWHMSDKVLPKHVAEAIELYTASQSTFGLHFKDGEYISEKTLKKTEDGRMEAIRLAYDKLKDEDGYAFPDELVAEISKYNVFTNEGHIKTILERMRLSGRLSEKNKMYKISWNL